MPGLALAAWMVWGLRFTTHDDLYFGIYANDPANSWHSTVQYLLNFSGRPAFLVAGYVTLAGQRVSAWGSLGDVVLLAHLALGLSALCFVVARLAGHAAAAAVALLLSGGFALHWFFMPPVGYPLLGFYSLVLLALSLAAMTRYADTGRRLWLALAIACSTLGCIGAEFNALVFPSITTALILALRQDWHARLRLLAAFLPGWASVALLILIIKAFLPAAEDELRLTVGSDPHIWFNAFGQMLGKSLLPSGLLLGIDLSSPPWPQRLDFLLIRRAVATDPLGFGFALLMWGASFWWLLRRLPPARSEFIALLGIGILLAVLPLAVTALSVEYQRNVLAGYTQGAVASAHAQIGTLLALFALAALLVTRKRWTLLPIAVVFALLCVTTLTYNLLMRDSMAANQQRWAAFDLLVKTLPGGARLHGPWLWRQAGVSSIPNRRRFSGDNYWTARARIQQARQLEVEDGPTPSPEAIRTSFQPRPQGQPVLWVEQGQTRFLLANSPGPEAGWRCSSDCRIEGARSLPKTPLPPRPGLAKWIALPRGGAFLPPP